MHSNFKQIIAVAVAAAAAFLPMLPARAQAVATGAALAGAPGVVVRRVVMKDAAAAEQFKLKLESMKATGLFRDLIPGAVPANPNNIIEISFLASGNYLLVVGKASWVDANIDSIRLMAYLFERPRAHLQLNLRVVQLTGPANTEVIQMTETVRALVDAQRDEVVRTLSDLDEYLTRRMAARDGSDRGLLQAAQELFPTLGTGDRPMTMPEILLLLMLDRSSPAPKGHLSALDAADNSEGALLDLPRMLAAAARDPHSEDAAVVREIAGPLAEWKKAVTAARDWCATEAEALKKSKDSGALKAFRGTLESGSVPIPSWLARRLLRSLDLTERLYPTLARRHTEESLRELQRRFAGALDRAAKIEAALAAGTEPAPAAKKERADQPAAPTAASMAMNHLGHNLVELKTVAEELVPSPLALFDAVAATADNAAPTPQQVVTMLKEYTVERRKLDLRLADDAPAAAAKDPAHAVNYSRLQALEASLNLWLRRVSEGMARALDSQFYSRYADELRLLANKQLGKSSSRDILSVTHIDQVPDLTRDLLLADTGVNLFVSNSISMQFAPETTNSVSANVQSPLPSKLSLLERVQQAEQATRSLSALNQAFGISGEGIVKALLAGGQAVPVQSGVNLSASPTIGFDASSVTLSLTASQTLSPGNEKVADRVTNHSINNATVNALSYEPMVLSTLASNTSYFEKVGGIPGIRKIPGISSILKDIPLAPFKEGKRQKGLYQSSVLILEPVVIPTIEDLVRFHAGWRDVPPEVPAPAAAQAAVPTADTGVPKPGQGPIVTVKPN